MPNWTAKTRVAPLMNDEVQKLMETCVQYPPRKLQSETYAGPITLQQYERFK